MSITQLSILFIVLILSILTMLLVIIIRRLNKLLVLYEPVEELLLGAKAPFFSAQRLDGQDINLNNYLKSATVFAFISPGCGQCDEAIKQLEEVAPQLKSKANVSIAFVSDGSLRKTQDLVDELKITLPVLLAPSSKTNFIKSYNPRLVFPYFVAVDRDIIVGRGQLKGMSWQLMRDSWLELPDSK